MTAQTDEKLLNAMLKEALEKDIINLLSERLSITHREAMDVYYRSELSCQIDDGEQGLQYLNAAYLVDDLLENETALVEK